MKVGPATTLLPRSLPDDRRLWKVSCSKSGYRPRRKPKISVAN
jgi:hypothetical protein